MESTLKRIKIKAFATGFAMASLIAISLELSNWYVINQQANVVTVEETYVVQPNDTFFGVVERYNNKNEVGKPYIYEYMDTIRELNPWVEARHGQLQVGDTLKIKYYKKVVE